MDRLFYANKHKINTWAESNLILEEVTHDTIVLYNHESLNTESQHALISWWMQPCAILSPHLLVLDGLCFGFDSQTVTKYQCFNDIDAVYGLVVFCFCYVLVHIITDLKVTQFVWVLAPTAQLIPFRCEEVAFISSSLVSSALCTWLQYKESKLCLQVHII